MVCQEKNGLGVKDCDQGNGYGVKDSDHAHGFRAKVPVVSVPAFVSTRPKPIESSSDESGEEEEEEEDVEEEEEEGVDDDEEMLDHGHAVQPESVAPHTSTPTVVDHPFSEEKVEESSSTSSREDDSDDPTGKPSTQAELKEEYSNTSLTVT